MPSTFLHNPSGTVLATSRTLIYGPVSSGQVAIVFAGVFTNNDSSTKAQHSVTLERYNGTTYTPVLVEAPIPYGGALKCPKLVVVAGESLYAKADASTAVYANLEILLNS